MGKKVSGVKLRSAERTVVDAELSRLDLGCNGSMPAKIDRLNEYIRLELCGDADKEVFDLWLETHWKDKRILICETCQGMSTIKFLRCPYCGNKTWDKDIQPKKDPKKILKNASVKAIAGKTTVDGITLGTVTLTLGGDDIEEAPSCEERLSDKVIQKITVIDNPVPGEPWLLIIQRSQIE